MRSARNRDLAQIHIARKQLQLEDVVRSGRCECGREHSAYHEMLFTVARVHSAADLDEAGRRSVLAHLRARGFNSHYQERTRGRPHNVGNSALMGKIEALLADAKRPWSYADSMSQRMFHVDRVAFLSHEQQQKLVAALAKDQRRRQAREEVSP